MARRVCWWALAVGLAAVGAPGATLPVGRPVYFVRDVAPIFDRITCSTGACHGRFSGQGNFKLSLMTLSAAGDYPAVKQFVNTDQPDQSPLIRRPAGQMPHGGGKRFETDSVEYQTLLAWIQQGCRDPQHEPLPVSLAVSPERLVFGPGHDSAQIKVMATFADGSAEDVTERTRYLSQDDNTATCDRNGVVQGKHWGVTAIVCRYVGLTKPVFVTTPRPPAANDPPQPKPEQANLIDAVIAKNWAWLNLVPSPLCDDYAFYRRLSLDLVGALPDPEDVRHFVADKDANKRAKLIDTLLDDPRFVSLRALRLGDLLRINPRKLDNGPLQARAAMMFDIWVREQVESNRPWNKVVYDLINATGSTMHDGPSNFYRVEKSPQDRAETVGQAFLGVRLSCARCHNHPFDRWTTDDYWQFAAFTAKVGSKRGEAYNEEIITHDNGATLINKSVVSANRDKVAVPTLLGERPIPSGYKGDYVQTLAAWMVSPENRYFAAASVNRIWSYLMGKGVVMPVDDIRNTSVPGVPALLPVLAREFVDSGYDVKAMYRTICNSKTYQRSAQPNSTNGLDKKHFSHYLPKQMTAQVLLDAINKACGTFDPFGSFPPGTTAVELPLYMNNEFLDLFGRSHREFLADLDPHAEPTLPQTLSMINSAYINNKVSARGGTVAQLEPQLKDDRALTDELYLRAVGRLATDTEFAAVKRHLAGAKTRREGFEDLLWSLITSREFLFIS